MAKISRAEQSERTRNKLMDATRDLVVESGWSGTSSRAIAGRAGVNLALINFHFGGKKKLFQATLDRCVAQVSSSYGPWGEARNIDEFIEMCSKGAPKISRDMNARFVFAALLESRRDKDIAAAVKLQLDAYREEISKSVEKMGFAGGVGRGATHLLAAAMDGLMIHLMLDRSTDAAGALAFMGDALGALLSDRSD